MVTRNIAIARSWQQFPSCHSELPSVEGAKTTARLDNPSQSRENGQSEDTDKATVSCNLDNSRIVTRNCLTTRVQKPRRDWIIQVKSWWNMVVRFMIKSGAKHMTIGQKPGTPTPWQTSPSSTYQCFGFLVSLHSPIPYPSRLPVPTLSVIRVRLDLDYPVSPWFSHPRC